jgi:hypothetical protein
VGFVIVIIVVLASGGTHKEIWSERYGSMQECRAAIGQVEASVKTQYPDAKNIKVECNKAS